jgi:predicted small lipoprotein YifL
VKQLILLLALIFILAACGEYVPPEATRSPVELRQTERALAGAADPLPTAAAAPQPTPDTAATALAAAAAADILAVPEDDPRALGDPAAPVVFIEFSDYE